MQHDNVTATSGDWRPYYFTLFYSVLLLLFFEFFSLICEPVDH